MYRLFTQQYTYSIMRLFAPRELSHARARKYTSDASRFMYLLVTVLFAVATGRFYFTPTPENLIYRFRKSYFSLLSPMKGKDIEVNIQCSGQPLPEYDTKQKGHAVTTSIPSEAGTVCSLHLFLP